MPIEIIGLSILVYFLGFSGFGIYAARDGIPPEDGIIISLIWPIMAAVLIPFGFYKLFEFLYEKVADL